MVGLEVIKTKYFSTIVEPTCDNLICLFFHECFKNYTFLLFQRKILNFLSIRKQNGQKPLFKIQKCPQFSDPD